MFLWVGVYSAFPDDSGSATGVYRVGAYGSFAYGAQHLNNGYSVVLARMCVPKRAICISITELRPFRNEIKRWNPEK